MLPIGVAIGGDQHHRVLPGFLPLSPTVNYVWLPSHAPVIDLCQDDDGVFACEMSGDMSCVFQELLDTAAKCTQGERPRVPAPCVALTKQLSNPSRDVRRAPR
jgi:hypothetical protein